MAAQDPDVTERLCQAFRWGQGRFIWKAPAKFDRTTGKTVVYLRDLLPARYQGTAYVTYGDNELVEFLTDDNDERHEPLRFEHLPETVLQIESIDESLALEYCASDSTALIVSLLSQLALDPMMASVIHPMQASMNEHLLVNLTHKMEEVIETQHKVIDTQHKHHAETIDMLSRLSDKANDIFRLTYELHEYPIPRLFIILPGRSSFKGKLNPLADKYRLYFLCECDQAVPEDGSEVQPHIHFAKHDGYDLERPSEFCKKYGPYILTMLQLLSVSMAAASFAVPPIAGIGKEVEKGLEDAKDLLKEKMKQTIVYLKDLPTREQVNTGNDPEDSDYDFKKIEALEGADLRHLASFLKNRDETRVLGNLYRLARPNGTIKWVCLDHYRKEYKEIDRMHFMEFVKTNGGKYNLKEGKVEMRLTSGQKAGQFYQHLLGARYVYELVVALDWDTSPDDFRELRKTMESLPTILRLTVDCCNKQSRRRDYIPLRSKASSILNKIMAVEGLQSFSIKNCNGFLDQIEKLDHTNKLRRIDLGPGLEERTQVSLIYSLIEKSSWLRHLIIHVPDIPSALLLYAKPDIYRFQGPSVLEAQVATGEILTAKIQGRTFDDIALEAENCTKDLSALSFVTKLTTAISTAADIDHLGLFLTKAKGLKEIVIEVEASKFFDIRLFIIQKGKSVRAVQFHDKTKESSLIMTDIRNPATAEIDLLDDSADFERLLTHFGAVPHSCGKNTVLTNAIFAKLEENTRKTSRIGFIQLDIAVLDEMGVDNAVSVIQRSVLRGLTICTSAQSKTLSVETTLLWRLIKEVVPSLNETLLRVECPEGQICHFYRFICSLVSADMKVELRLSDGHSTISMDDTHDTRTSIVSMHSDNIGMPLEEFYEMFRCLPSVLGVNTPISDSVVPLLEKVIQPGDTSLRGLNFDPSILSHGSRDLLLDLIGRCSLRSLDIQYHDDAVDLIVQLVRIVGEGQLTVHCKTEMVPSILKHLRGILSSDGMGYSFRLTDDLSTIIVDDIRLVHFRFVSEGDAMACKELFDINDILSTAQGYSSIITFSAAAKMEQWTRSFPSPYKKIWIDTSRLGEEGIQEMTKVISRSNLSTLSVLCCRFENEGKDMRERFLPQVLPYLASSELYIHCPVKEFAEVWELLRAYEPADQTSTSWKYYLCDGDRKLDILPNSAPKLAIHGAGGDYYKDAWPVTDDNLGDTMLELGPFVELLDMEDIIFSDKDAVQWSESTAGFPQLSLNTLRLSTAHLGHEGLNHLQNVLDRSHSLADFSFICECNRPIFTAVTDILVRNKATIRELVLKGPNIQQWIQAISAILPDRESLPLMTSLQITLNGETLDDMSCSWISSMTRARRGLPELKKIRLRDLRQSSKFWTSFLRFLDKASLEELDLSGSTVSEIDICAAGYSLDAPLKILNLRRTNVPPSSKFVFNSLTNGRPLEILLDAP